MKHVFAASAALAALIAMPAFAQTTTSTSSTQPAAATSSNSGDLMSSLKSAGVMQPNEVNGHVMKAEIKSGAPGFVVIVPKNFTGSVSSTEAQVKSTLTTAGLKDLVVVPSSQVVKGTVNDQDSDHEGVLVISGLNFSNDKNGADLNKSQFADALKSAGINEASNFHGKLASAKTADGKEIYMIVGDQNLTPDGGKFNFNDKSVRTAFDKANLKQLKMLDDTQVVQAQMNGDTLFVVSGKDLTKS